MLKILSLCMQRYGRQICMILLHGVILLPVATSCECSGNADGEILTNKYRVIALVSK